MRYLKTFESFNKVAFHGYMMDPDDMQLPECELEWTPGKDGGCPSFSDSPKITKEDENLAIKYLDQKDINTLIAYSRGGAILIQSVAKGAELPKKLYLVAPAWLRGWTTVQLKGDEITGANGYIIHGGKDDKVPLKHSAILSKMSGLPLYVFPDCDHVNILKHKDDISGGLEAKNIDELIEALPDWNEKSPTPEELDKQYYISTIL
jgi:pimeloyl-ACP methyl ester carboxylesterase